MNQPVQLPARRGTNAAQFPQPQSLADYERLAIAFSKSGFFEDAREAAQCLVKLMAGAEFGIGPFASMQGVYIVKGKPTMAATTIAGVIKRSGIYNFRVVEHTNEACELEFFENGESVGKSRFTMADAARAGLQGGVNWKNFPRNMLYARAMTNGARWYCPDVFGGAIYSPDELNENVVLDDSGQVRGGLAALSGGTASNTTQTPPGDKPKAVEIKTLLQLFEVAKQVLPPTTDAAPWKLGYWLIASGIAAPDLAERDEIAGTAKRQITPEESRAAYDALVTLIVERLPDEAKRLGLIEGGATTTAAQGVARAVAPEFEVPQPDVGETPPPPDDDEPLPLIPDSGGLAPSQRVDIQNMFAARVNGLKAHYATRGRPDLTSQEKRRHAFAADVLGNDLKASSKTWSQEEYRKVRTALEMIPPDPKA